MELGNAMFGHSRGEYEVDRGWAEIFMALCDKIGVDGYGAEYENDTFSMFPYYWGDADCEYDQIERPCPCMENCPTLRPNFLYKPTGYFIMWYKYPMRDAYANAQITRSDFMKIILNCIDSVDE